MENRKADNWKKVGEKKQTYKMETTILKTMKGATMEHIFDNSKVLSIRHFNALNLKKESDWKPEEKYKYEITVRHPEGTDAKLLLDMEVKQFENNQQKNNEMGTLKLQIANCRGEKPVLNTIKKCHSQLGDLLIELNYCEGKTQLNEAIKILNRIIQNN